MSFEVCNLVCKSAVLLHILDTLGGVQQQKALRQETICTRNCLSTAIARAE
jgi:hypothetical protein